ncbi:MAG: hypothetical protein Q7R76_00735 [Candidatus Woesearchaeota archaeon]|nr:hypothetical protein [Candidatus Woesearchaeota archaeon]
MADKDGNGKEGTDHSIDEKNWEQIEKELRAEGASGTGTNGAYTTTTQQQNGSNGTGTKRGGLEGAVNAPDLAQMYHVNGAGNGSQNPLTAKAKELGLLEGINLPGTQRELDTMQKQAEETPNFLEQKMKFLADVKVEDYYGTLDGALIGVARRMGTKVYGTVQGWVDNRVKKGLKDMVRSDLEEQATKLRANVERYEKISGELSKVGEKYSQRSIVGNAMLQQETYPKIAEGYKEIERLNKDLAAATQSGDFTKAHAARMEGNRKEKEVAEQENFYERLDFRVKAARTATTAVEGLIERATRYSSMTQRYLMAVEEKISMLGMVDEIAGIQFEITPANLENLDFLLSDAGNMIGARGCEINHAIQAGGDPTRGPDLKPDYLASDAEAMRTETYRSDRRARIERLHSERVSQLNEAAAAYETPPPSA